MESLIHDVRDEAGTEALGTALSEVLPEGSTIALCGTLGAGKTRLVQAIAEASGIQRRDVVSPTFVLAQEYHGQRLIYHLDAYRLRDEDEFLELGPEEYFESPGLTFIEWADRVERCLPEERIDILIEVTGNGSRRFRLTAHGPRYAGMIERLRARLAE
jgi:tRNA threonylcarbamoyladenosine biosynthesis protein TsaE